MNKGYLNIIILLVSLTSWSQTNTFPDSGNVGIGTNAPSSKLHIQVNNGAVHTRIQTSASGTAGVHLRSGGSDWRLEGGSDLGRFRVTRESTEYFSVLNNGNVGIGTTNPLSQLVVGNSFGVSISGSSGGNAVFGTNIAIHQGGSSPNQLYTPYSHNNNYGYAGIHARWGDLRFYTQDGNTTEGALITPTTRMLINPDGNVGLGTTSPRSVLDVRTAGQSGVIANFLSDAGISDGVEIHRWTIRIGRNFDYPNRALDFGMVSDSYGQNPAFYVAPKGTEVFRITESGNVGIGTTNPDANLTIGGSDLVTYNLKLKDQAGRAIELISPTIGSPVGKLKITNTNSSLQLGVRDFPETIHIKGTDGNVGIGTTNPDATLTIGGSDLVTYNLKLKDQAGRAIELISPTIGSPVGKLKITNTNSSLQLGVRDFPETMHIKGTDGNVGIGTTNPEAKLHVAGNIYSTEVKVAVAAGTGPDYVFEPDYDLRTLQETKDYIEENKHLPEVPSAKEMETNGVQLGEMNMLLLKKIEEMTLHQIELLERLEKAEKEIAYLQGR